MISKAIAAESEKNDSEYLALIEEHLAEIGSISKEIAQKRSAGRKVQISIDRKLKEIRQILNRVEATL